jgi:hypothetical protein
MFSQAAINRKHAAIDTSPRRNSPGSQISSAIIMWFRSDLGNNAYQALSARISDVNFWPFLANEGSLKEGQVVDPAEEGVARSSAC